ncbi:MULTISPECIES: helix-turn-helix domain-containing protein [unclassified Sphingomonas]|uniref:helix-turn-helix domain-containing protein n=1 Tax=unclassified Sphingomonas TaxID=196159 RepID=UPI000A66215D|nr:MULTISPECIES: helix-turn-helix domain-containing protein [unclassified Sphingomonas]
MLLQRLHKEDVKAVLRKRYRSVAAFERAENLSKLSVSEVLRGRPSKRTQVAIERVLQEELGNVESITPVDSAVDAAAHRLNAEVK